MDATHIEHQQLTQQQVQQPQTEYQQIDTQAQLKQQSIETQQQHFQQTIFQYSGKPATNSPHTSNNKWNQRPPNLHHSPYPPNNHNQQNQAAYTNNHSNNHNGGIPNGASSPTFQQNNQNQGQKKQQTTWAAKILGTEPVDILCFDEVDTLNPSNRVSGFICKKTDKMLIAEVNAAGAQTLLHAPPVHFHAIRNNTFAPVITPQKCKKYFLSYKWNGVNVTVYKYQDKEGNLFVSARPRGFAFLRDTDYVKHFSVFVDCLSKLEPPVSLPLKMASLPPIFDKLNFDIQSITCELFGANMPHLIRYPFDVRLKPVYFTHLDGGISPFSEVEEGLVVTPTDTEEEVAESLATAVEAGVGLYCGPIDINHSNPALLENLCRMLSLKAQQMNNLHRKNSGLPDGARNFDNFLVEGWVLHLLDENGVAVDQMFLLQPDDIKQTHWQSFDAAAQLKTVVTLRELRLKGKPNVSPGDLKREMGMSNYQWVKFGRDVMSLMDGIPAPLDVNKRDKNAQRMILLVGIPGSGKSTFSRQLVGKGWERCNQDELGNRKVVEQAVSGYLKDRKNVIVDRCNFDIVQRHTWVKIASQFGVKWITCIILRTDPEVCKKRVSVREGHQTIPSGDSGHAIIDRFKDMWVEPHVAEGFCEILEIRSELEMENVVQRFVINHLENQVDSMQSTIQQLQRKIREMERAPKDQIMHDNPYQVPN